MPVAYIETPCAYGQVSPRGFLSDRIELSLEKLLRDRDSICEYSGWGADQVGRWIGATAVLGAVTGRNLSDAIQPKVEELLRCQDETGLFYGDKLVASYDPRQASSIRKVWFGQGRAIINLLEYHESSRDPVALNAVIRAADCCLAGQGEWVVSNPICGGIESVIRGMVSLAGVTGQEKYIGYGKWLTDHIDGRPAPPSERVWAHVPLEELQHTDIPHGHHTHSYLCITHGTLDLAVATGEYRYLERAERVFEESLPSVWMTGDIPEDYGELYEYNDETCSVVDWIMLGLKLFRATGQARYLDVVEHAFLNQLLFGQDSGGGFTADRSLDRRHWVDEKNWGCVADACCTPHGGWLLGQVARHVITANRDGLSVNLPLEIHVRLEIGSSSADVTQAVDIGREVVAQKTTIVNSGDAVLQAKIRLPHWCDSPEFAVNGGTLSVDRATGFGIVECLPRAETHVELHLPMKMRVIPSRRSIFTRDTAGAPGEAAEEGLQYGPFVLMFNREMYRDVVEKDIVLTVPLDGNGVPRVRHDLPGSRSPHGGIPLLVEAELDGGKPVLLTPCANMTMTPFTVPDPYLMRFSRIRLMGNGE